MAKTTKRSKKFVAKGGVKAMLEKGTVTKKGKLKMRKKQRPSSSGGGKQKEQEGPGAAKRNANNEEDGHGKRRRTGGERDASADDGEFTSEKNLGDLDMDSFFLRTAAEADEGGTAAGADDEAADEESLESNPDDDDDDDEGSSNEDSVSDDDEDYKEAERRMKREMEKLQSSDPEFHKFLKDNERSLLEFGIDDDEDDVDMDGGDGQSSDSDYDEDDDDEERGMDDGGEKKHSETRKLKDNKGKPTKKKDEKESKAASKKDDKKKKTEEQQEEQPKLSPGQFHLTPTLLSSYERSAFESRGMKGLRRLVAAYRTACHLADPQQQQGEEEDGIDRGDGGGSGRAKYHIDSPVVFDRLMVTTLQRSHEAFRYHLIGPVSFTATATTTKKAKGGTSKPDGDDDDKSAEQDVEWDENKPISPKVLHKSERWNDVRPILHTFFKSTLHVLSEAKEPELLTFVLKNLSMYVPFLTPFPRIAKALLKSLTSLWSAPANDAVVAEYRAVRLQAFLRIRQLALTQPFPFIEDCLKYTYLSYAKSAKFITSAAEVSTLPTLTFLGNCVVELYSIDLDSSYQHAFVYIRQLALHLRSALQKKTTESFQVVYCWQYVNCLKLWTAVLSANAAADGDSGLRSLVYPLTEIIFGVARLLPTVRHLPLRFHCVRLLQQLAASSRMFIPTTTILLDTIDLKELYMKPKKASKKSSGQGCYLPLLLKLSGGKDDALRTSEQLDTCVSELFLLMNREVDLYRYSAGFPEFSVRICQRLRKFCKETKVGRWRAYAKGCIEVCGRHSEYATKNRSLLTEAPKDVQRLEILKPPDVPDMKARYESSISKEHKIESREHPVVTEASKKKERVDGKVEGEKRPEIERKKKVYVGKADLNDTRALEEADEIEEGVDWSDED